MQKKTTTRNNNRSKTKIKQRKGQSTGNIKRMVIISWPTIKLIVVHIKYKRIFSTYGAFLY